MLNRSLALAGPSLGRIHRTQFGSTSAATLALHSGFLRLVSIAEATVDSLGVEATNRRVGAVDQSVRLLILEKELAATSTWDARRRVFRRHHGVDLRKCDEFKRMEAANDVRNAIAHGLGRLTARQVHSPETVRRISSIGVDVVDGYVSIEERHLVECAGYARLFLTSVDREVQ